MIFQQGDIIYLDCDPQSGHEQAGRRPVLVISRLYFQQGTNFAVICPITRTSRNFPMHVQLSRKTQTIGYILCEQLKSLDIDSRNPVFIEKAPLEIVESVLKIIKSVFFMPKELKNG